MLQDPVQAEFFTAENVGGLSHALVREAVQNALDARLSPAKPVVVRFAIVQVNASRAVQYFEGLIPHLDVVIGEQAKALQQPTIPFLTVEDFNTRGLVGDYTISVEKDAKENNFFYFWRNVGRSGKSGDNRGRWGLGKSVFAVISGISTFFGLTVRAKETELLLMGQSVLRYHKLQGSKFYTPYGNFGEYDEKRPDFSLPVRDGRRTKGFCTTFELRRVSVVPKTGLPQTLPGLSIVIPLPDPEITRETLVQAVIDQYFYPIISQSLYIEIEKAILKLDQLVDEINKLAISEEEKTRYRSLIKFTQWSLALPEQQIINLHPPANLTNASNWNYEFLNEEELAQARAHFQEFGQIAFRVPVKVQTTRGAPVLSHFKVFIERDDSITRAENYFIREGITISGIRTMTQRGLRGMVVVDEQPLTSMLGDAENPAHTEWHKDSLKFKGKYQHGASTLSFVKNSLKILAAQVTVTTKEIDQELLKDIFSFPDPVRPNAGKSKRTSDGKTDNPVVSVPEIESHPKPLDLHQLQNGVVISTESIAGKSPEHIIAEFAYDVRTGDPFKKYIPVDFDLGNGMLTLETTNVDIQVRQENRLEFNIIGEPFEVRVSGFDPYRDLKVRLKWEGESE